MIRLKSIASMESVARRRRSLTTWVWALVLMMNARDEIASSGVVRHQCHIAQAVVGNGGLCVGHARVTGGYRCKQQQQCQEV